MSEKTCRERKRVLELRWKRKNRAIKNGSSEQTNVYHMEPRSREAEKCHTPRFSL